MKRLMGHVLLMICAALWHNVAEGAGFMTTAAVARPLPMEAPPAVVAGDRLYMSHLMAATSTGVTGAAMTSWGQALVAAGYNAMWLHCDNYYAPTNEPDFNSGYVGESKYPAAVTAWQAAAGAAGNLKIMAGLLGNVQDINYKFLQVLKDVFAHATTLRVDGKPVVAIYDVRTNVESIVAFAETYGYDKDDYLLFCYTRFPPGGISHTTDPDDYDDLFAGYPSIDGLLGFAVDFTPSDSNFDAKRDMIIAENALMAARCAAAGKYAVAGVSGYYLSTGAPHDLGFARMAAIWDGILTLDVLGVSDTTANDIVEVSHMGPLPNVVAGLVEWPPVGGFAYGPNTRRPVVDHSGMQRFLRPWVDAWLAEEPAPVFTEDRLFAWYQLHPKSASVMPKNNAGDIPASIASDAGVDFSWWSSAQNPFTTRPPHAEWAPVDNIRVAAHLTEAGKLRINGSTSGTTFGAGTGYYEVSLSSFRGVPEFAIVRNGADVAVGSGPQAITDQVWPGAWSPMVVELPLDEPFTYEFFVGPSGNDGNDGLTPGTALATLTAARNRLRVATGRTAGETAISGPWNGAAITLLGGTYFLENEVGGALRLDGRDSGDDGAPVVWRAADGASPVFTAAHRIVTGEWSLVTSADAVAWARLPAGIRAQVYKADLTGDLTDFGQITYDKGSPNTPSNLMFFTAGGQWRPWARRSSDDTAWWKFDTGLTTTRFRDAQAELGGYDPAGQLIVCQAFPAVEYQPNYTPVNGITNVGGGVYEVLTGFTYGISWAEGYTLSSGVGPNSGRYRFLNALEDMAAGYAVWIPSSKTIYYLPPSGGAPPDATVSATAIGITLSSTNHLTMEGLTLDGARDIVVKVVSGTGVVFDGCTFRNYGSAGVRFGDALGGNVYANHVISGDCWESGVRDCTFRWFGGSAMQGRSGNRVALQDGECFFTGNTVRDGSFSDLEGGVYLFGHGWTVSGNTFQDMPGPIAQLNGNAAVFSGNTVTNVCRVLGDASAVYSGRSHTRMENVISGNTFLDVGAAGRTNPPHITSATWGVYLDDAVAGFTVTGNTFTNSSASVGGSGLLVASGRRTVVTDNVFTNVHKVVGVRTWHGFLISERFGASTILLDKANIDGSGVGVDDAPWVSTAPYSVLNTEADDGTLEKPVNCTITGNQCTSDSVLVEIWDRAAAPGTGAISYINLSQVNKNQAGSNEILDNLKAVSLQ